MTRWTTTMPSRPSSRTRPSSPACTACAGLTFTPLTLTCPARQAPDAADRVLASRTDQIQLSTRPVCSPATHQTVNDTTRRRPERDLCMTEVIPCEYDKCHDGPAGRGNVPRAR